MMAQVMKEETYVLKSLRYMSSPQALHDRYRRQTDMASISEFRVRKHKREGRFQVRKRVTSLIPHKREKALSMRTYRLKT